ncbi:hypothetical protein Zmor_004477 [Zophobas morio]|jgi:hypothetical protein|uniref:Uncharacterized protein n=1 Tax=Zophobas morio TaxID=2755281 RepID=A0AA38HIW2_9CUCU|nr:hypothetical protein Zmor_004477 [Zophobas morio]
MYNVTETHKTLPKEIIHERTKENRTLETNNQDTWLQGQDRSLNAIENSGEKEQQFKIPESNKRCKPTSFIHHSETKKLKANDYQLAITYLTFNEAKNANDKNFYMRAAKNELLSITHHKGFTIIPIENISQQKPF